MSMKKDELRPCPLCGSQPVLDEVKPHTHSEWLKKELPDLPDSHGECFVECWNCSCAVAAPTKKQAVALWNNRKGFVGVDDFTVMIFALRYAVNRLSYAPGLVCDYLRDKLPLLNSNQKEMLVKELKDKLKYRECADDIAEHYVKKLLAEVEKQDGK